MLEQAGSCHEASSDTNLRWRKAAGSLRNVYWMMGIHSVRRFRISSVVDGNGRREWRES